MTGSPHGSGKSSWPRSRKRDGAVERAEEAAAHLNKVEAELKSATEHAEVWQLKKVPAGGIDRGESGIRASKRRDERRD